MSLQPLYTVHEAGPSATEEEGVWNMAVEQFVTCTVVCVGTTVQYSVMYCLKYVINRKIQNFSLSGE